MFRGRKNIGLQSKYRLWLRRQISSAQITFPKAISYAEFRVNKIDLQIPADFFAHRYGAGIAEHPYRNIFVRNPFRETSKIVF